MVLSARASSAAAISLVSASAHVLNVSRGSPWNTSSGPRAAVVDDLREDMASASSTKWSRSRFTHARIAEPPLRGSGAALLDGARLAREILLEERRCGARAPRSSSAWRGGGRRCPCVRSSRGDALAERVVEQDAPALLGEELGEVREELGHAARLGVALERRLAPTRRRRPGPSRACASCVRDVGERLLLLVLVPDVPLRDDEDDLVARLAEQLVLEEDALALLEGWPASRRKSTASARGM